MSAALFQGSEKAGAGPIKTLLKKIVHNKNHKPCDPSTGLARPADS
ncbi:MAG: hypothetical protein V4600_24950 [Pseudomonadota bacterium]|nr:hypothetical protein [Pseudomonas sp. FG1]MDY7554425.1 hypothetical protein [Pseudomonas sp. FG1]